MKRTALGARVSLSKGKENQVVWPVYLDSAKSRKQGRRIAMKFAVESPKIQEIEQAADLLGYKHDTKLDSAHPKTWWEKKGYVLIEKKNSKIKVLEKIANKIVSLRKKPEIKK